VAPRRGWGLSVSSRLLSLSQPPGVCCARVHFLNPTSRSSWMSPRLSSRWGSPSRGRDPAVGVRARAGSTEPGSPQGSGCSPAQPGCRNLSGRGYGMLRRRNWLCSVCGGDEEQQRGLECLFKGVPGNWLFKHR